jgi:hypothetical protein
MDFRQVVGSRWRHWLPLVFVGLLLVGALDLYRFAWAGDPGGDKTGVATDEQNASGLRRVRRRTLRWRPVRLGGRDSPRSASRQVYA